LSLIYRRRGLLPYIMPVAALQRAWRLAACALYRLLLRPSTPVDLFRLPRS
jgi:hypothetical protein